MHDTCVNRMYEDLFRQQGLSMDRLYALVRLSETGSLIAAAKGDSGLQSRYSHYLRELAGFFGTELTERSGKSIRLTAAGEELVQMVRKQFSDLVDFKNQIHDEPHIFLIGAGDSLLQWLLIPAIGTLRRPGQPFRFALKNLRTAEIVAQLQEHRLEFGILRLDAVPRGLQFEDICVVKHAVFVPERLVPRRGLLTLRQALLDCSHAALASDGQMSQGVQEIAQTLGGQFRPELICDSLAQCLAAVKTGSYAAILPMKSWTPSAEMQCHVVEDTPLESLNRKVVLAWHPRLLEVRENLGKTVRDALRIALRAGGVPEE
jgi:DNA-binding transcriptional LysR family regulator